MSFLPSEKPAENSSSSSKLAQPQTLLADAVGDKPRGEIKAVFESLEGTPMENLTPIQLKYLEGRLNGLNCTAAARYAGCSEKSIRASSYQLERHPKVQAAAKFALESGFGSEIDREAVLTGLMDAVRSAATSAELTMAWREIGRLIGAYAPDRTEVVVHNLTSDKLRTVSDRELLGLRDKGAGAPTEVVQTMEGEFDVLREACREPEPIIDDYEETRHQAS